MMFEEMTYDELELRCGELHLGEEQFRYDIKLWHRIMSKILVVRCEYRMDRRSFEYIALSPLFDKRQPGERPPCYEFSINEYNDLEAVRADD